MTEQEVRSLFTIAGFEYQRLWRLENGYWPLTANYDEIRRDNPWWLVKTEFGLIEIGWRKRVIEINWSDTALTPSREMPITKDDVTQTVDLVHAWSLLKAAEYLTEIRKRLERL